MNTIFITGSSGFIGFHLSKYYLDNGFCVVGVDNMNDYYDINLKKNRVKILNEYDNFVFYEQDLINKQALHDIFSEYKFDLVVNLAAQAGVRYSLTNPEVYVDSNITGFINLLECMRNSNTKNLIYASSSSVYGLSDVFPTKEECNTNNPISLYGGTKKANEVLVHSYNHLHQMNVIGLRFFTVYGPMGRPDMALFLFTKNILEGRPIELFNYGNHSRSFTYIDDIVQSIYLLSQKDYFYDGSSVNKIFNIGGHESINLKDFVKIIEKNLGKKAEILLKPMQKGDVKDSMADNSLLFREINFNPKTNFEEGAKNFIEWYKKYYSA
jgi:UDP-glucuronate 4-epimerase